MSSASLPFDPYRPPDEILAEPARGGRPGGLTAICVLAIVLGALGLCSALMTTGALLVQKQLQRAMQPQVQPGMNKQMQQMQEIQQEMQNEMQAINDQYFPINMLFALAHIVVAALLLVGGIRTLGLNGAGRIILLTGCGLAVAFELSRTVVQVMVGLKNMAVMETFMPKILASGPGGANSQQAQEMVGTFMKVGIFISFAFIGIWVLLKVVFYGWSLMYLNQPRIKGLFEPTLPAALAPRGGP